MVSVLASAPFLGQILQAPAVLLVERLRRRKAIAVLSSLIGPSMLLLLALAVFMLSAWDFYFLFAGLLGFYALHRLSLVNEEGHIERREMVLQLLGETRRVARNLGTVSGLRALTELPAALLHDARVRARWLRRNRALAGSGRIPEWCAQAMEGL
jgi:hypothetical protein